MVGAENGQELARHVDSPPRERTVLSGTWTADAASLSVESLADMLRSTATKEVTGSWRSGRHQGNWSLKDLRQPGLADSGAYFSLAYSDFAAISMGISASASFQRVRKS